jgi:hypothetical protein
MTDNPEADMNADDQHPEGSADDPAEAGRGQAESAVGYRRPPRAACFRRGQSGNTGGRPKGARNLSTVVKAALGKKVEVTVNGRIRRISKLEAAIVQLANRAAQGDRQATRDVIALAEAAESRGPGPDAAWRPGAGDQIVIADLLRRAREEP